MFKKVIFKCLELINRYKYFFIVIFVLSVGVLGYLVVELVRVILDVIELYIKIVFFFLIKEVYFCDVDDIIVKEFVICFKRKFGLEVKEFSGDEYGLLFSDVSISCIKYFNNFIYNLYDMKG